MVNGEGGAIQVRDTKTIGGDELDTVPLLDKAVNAFEQEPFDSFVEGTIDALLTQEAPPLVPISSSFKEKLPAALRGRSEREVVRALVRHGLIRTSRMLLFQDEMLESGTGEYSPLWEFVSSGSVDGPFRLPDLEALRVWFRKEKWYSERGEVHRLAVLLGSMPAARLFYGEYWGDPLSRDIWWPIYVEKEVLDFRPRSYDGSFDVTTRRNWSAEEPYTIPVYVVWRAVQERRLERWLAGGKRGNLVLKGMESTGLLDATVTPPFQMPGAERISPGKGSTARLWRQRENVKHIKKGD